MEKELVKSKILNALDAQLKDALIAAKTAHDAATNDESKAENKYDTRGLEASYLAEGQSRRVQIIEDSLSLYNSLNFESFNADSNVRLTAIVTLEPLSDINNHGSYDVFIGPSAGGLTIPLDSGIATIVTPGSPIGQVIIGKEVGDEISVDIAGSKVIYELVSIR